MNILWKGFEGDKYPRRTWRWSGYSSTPCLFADQSQAILSGQSLLTFAQQLSIAVRRWRREDRSPLASRANVGELK